MDIGKDLQAAFDEGYAAHRLEIANMKPMVYQEKGKREVLAHGQDPRGYGYVILNLGTHPTAYVSLARDDPYYGKSVAEIDEDIVRSVHGGLTYSSEFLHGDESYDPSPGWWIGWDYAHCDDYMGYYTGDSEADEWFRANTKKWTLREIYDEAMAFIDKLDERRKARASRTKKTPTTEDMTRIVLSLRNCVVPMPDSCSKCPYQGVDCRWNLMIDAADAIEKAQAELADAEKDKKELQKKLKQCEKDLKRVRGCLSDPPFMYM